MAIEIVKVAPLFIRIRKGRPSFVKWHNAEYRKNDDGTLDKGTPERPKQPKFTATLLIDPSSVEGAEDIGIVKAEAAYLMDNRYVGPWKGKARGAWAKGNTQGLPFDGVPDNSVARAWPTANPATGMGAPIYCFGNGNDLRKVYDGYKDMFYIKCGDTERPLLGSVDGREVRLLSDGWHVCNKDHEPTEEKVDQKICPYGGCDGRGRISLYTYDNKACGINSNIISYQFTKANAAFGGGSRNSRAEDEFDSYAEYAAAAAQNNQAPDPFG